MWLFGPRRGLHSACTHMDLQAGLVRGIVEQMMTDLADRTLDRSMLHIQAWNVWGRIRISVHPLDMEALLDGVCLEVLTRTAVHLHD